MISRQPTDEEKHKHRTFLRDREKHVSIDDLRKNREQGKADAMENVNSNNLDVVIRIVRRHNACMEAYLDAKLNTLKKICEDRGHVIATNSLDWTEWYAGGAVCIVCGKDFGWYCTENPDPKKPYCEYDREHGECCIHCGLPEERK